MRRTNREIIDALDAQATEAFNKILLDAKHNGEFDGDFRKLYWPLRKMADRARAERSRK